jgi:hypothetical protein
VNNGYYPPNSQGYANPANNGYYPSNSQGYANPVNNGYGAGCPQNGWYNNVLYRNGRAVQVRRGNRVVDIR